MKVLRLDLMFFLPDDFDGDLNDALGYIIKYRANDAKSPQDDIPANYSEKLTYIERWNKTWLEFNETAVKEQRRLIANYSFAEFDEATGKWMSDLLIRKGGK